MDPLNLLFFGVIVVAVIMFGLMVVATA